MRQLFLASGSPRRAELLAQADIPFTRLPAPGIDETPRAGEKPEDYVWRMASEKALAGWHSLPQSERQDAAVLGADTSVVLGTRVLGKPSSAAEAQAMLTELAGTEHRVLSGVSLVWQERTDTCVSESRVRFAPLAPEQVAQYVNTGEWRDKAGGYAIQGRAAVLIEEIAGSYSGVVGLPLRETMRLLQGAQVNCWATGC